jgi:hypothetical protein
MMITSLPARLIIRPGRPLALMRSVRVQIAAALILLLAASLFLVRFSTSPTTGPLPPQQDFLIAYRDKTRIGLVDKSGVKTIGTSREPSGSGGPSFTNDERFLFWIEYAGSDENANDNRIGSYEASTGIKRSVRCSCTAAVAISGSTVGWTAGTNSYAKLDLATDKGPRNYRVAFEHATQGTISKLTLHGAVDGHALISYSLGGRPDQVHLGLVDPTGVAMPIGSPFNGNEVLKTAVWAQPSDDIRHKIAVAIGRSERECGNQDEVYVVDLETGTRKLADTTSLRGPVVPSAYALNTWDIWWGNDGKLYSIFSSKRCPTSNGSQQLMEPSVWRLDSSWLLIHLPPVIAVRSVVTSLAVVSGVDPGSFGPYLDYERTGTLYTEAMGARTVIAIDVFAVAVEPSTVAGALEGMNPIDPVPQCDGGHLPVPYGSSDKGFSLSCAGSVALVQSDGQNGSVSKFALLVAAAGVWVEAWSGDDPLSNCGLEAAGLSVDDVRRLFPGRVLSLRSCMSSVG